MATDLGRFRFTDRGPMRIDQSRHRDMEENIGARAPGTDPDTTNDDEPKCSCQSGFSRSSGESVEHKPDCPLANRPGSSSRDRSMGYQGRLNTQRFVAASNRLRNRDAMPGEEGGCNCAAGDDETGHDPDCPKYRETKDLSNEEIDALHGLTPGEQARRATDRFVRASDARHRANTAPRFRR
jgi:hypothetical protein